jgi:transposase
MVLMVGVDVHKGTHTAVVVDELGRKRAQLTVRAVDAGHLELVAWAVGQAGGQSLCWAIEDCRHVSVRVERALLGAGHRVLRVPPKLMAGARSSARTRGKSDPIDALAIARAALREPDLPVAEHDGDTRELKLLVDHREQLVAERTRKINRLRWQLHELDPELDLPARGLDKPTRLDWLAEWLAGVHSEALIGELAAENVTDIRALTSRIRALDRRVEQRSAAIVPGLLALEGCGPLSAGKIIGETARPGRFRSEACFAMHAGVAPLPASSGRRDRHRLTRGGNRQLNAALHRIAIAQIGRPGSLGRAYYDRRRQAGNNAQDALRALKRRLARVVFTLLNNPTNHPVQPAA